MSVSLTQGFNPKLFRSFEQSTLGLYAEAHTEPLFAVGTVSTLAEGAVLEPGQGRRLVVVLTGCVLDGSEWYGPGNHLEQTDRPVAAFKGQARIWVLDMTSDAWQATSNIALRRATTHALIAADAAEAAATPPADLPDPATLCDVDHPEIRRRAARLRRATPVSTAEAILQYVMQIPYRFGTWQERASDTMARGVGMCTTKANLQVALMRASGLEAGFVEVPMSLGILGDLMPDAWLALQRDQVRHYFAAVKLDDRWHAVDSSYDPASVRIYLRQMPHMTHCLTPTLEIGKPFAPALECIPGAGLFDFEVRQEINEVMGKSSRFLPRHFEALNTCMDRERGYQKSWNKALSTAVTTDDEALA